MQFFRKNIINKLFLFVTALQVLNISIDAPGAQLSTQADHHEKFNYIDSYVEFVAEIVLKYENAIPESHNRQQKELQQHKQLQVICENAETQGSKTFSPPPCNFFIAYSNKYAYRFIKEIKSPPRLMTL
ncbi:MAG: hypothetical protein ABJA57_05790 [Ginsengibacter sp.]